MRIMTPNTILNIVAAVGLFAEVLRLVMTIDAHVEDWLLEQSRLEAAVHLVADDTLAIGHR